MNNSQGMEECQILIEQCRGEFSKAVVGQASLFDALITSLVTGGHILLEGLPGLAKTTAAKAFATITGLSFKRVQFTPDLLPQDITGTLVYEQTTGKFIARKGPIFANVVLADEINRAGAKVQSALLEAMQEKQVTLGAATLVLPSPFIVTATENPIDEDGTYSLPAAERDRFLIKEIVPYPTAEEECAIANSRKYAVADIKAILDENKILLLQSALSQVICDERLVRYIVDIVRATRPNMGERSSNTRQAEYNAAHPVMPHNTLPRELSDDISRYVSVGASPRGSIALLLCAKSRALIAGRPYVLPEDIKAASLVSLRHRLSFTFEATSDDVSADDIISKILNTIPIP